MNTKEDYSGLGVKQKDIIRIGKQKGFLDISEVRSYYPSINDLQSSMKTLEFQGYFKKIFRHTGYRWIYIKEAKK